MHHTPPTPHPPPPTPTRHTPTPYDTLSDSGTPVSRVTARAHETGQGLCTGSRGSGTRQPNERRGTTNRCRASHHTNQKHTNQKHTAMPIQRDTPAWRKLRTTTINQARTNNTPCMICGQPINYQATDPNAPNAPSVDHIKHWANNPNSRLDPTNLRITHQACNRARGQHDTPTLGNQSRRWGKPNTTPPSNTRPTTGG